MKNYLYTAIFFISTISISWGQAYEGQGDQKFQVGANLQNHGTGVTASYDFGLGENISVGAVSSYLLGIDNGIDRGAWERFEAKVRFSAHLGPILEVSDAFDLYPGLDLGLKNFGFHTGARYFFSEGLGVFTEFGFPIAKYQTEDLTPADEFHNQFAVNLGVVFNFL